MTGLFIPDHAFLERQVERAINRERRRQDSRWGGWDHDYAHGGRGFADLIDKQRGQLADVFVSGGRYGAFDRKAAFKEFVQIAALAKRAAELVMAECHEAHGEHVADDLIELFELPPFPDEGAEVAAKASDGEQGVPF